MSLIAATQMITSACVEDNLVLVEQMFLAAKERDVNLLVLPENFAYMGNDRGLLLVAESYKNGPIQRKLSGLAKYYQLWVVAGTLPLQGKEKICSSCLVFDEQGKEVARYDKMHLFDVQVSEQEVYQESDLIERGDKPVVVDSPLGRLGLSICYDVRFPELYRQLVCQGAEIITVPSAFTVSTGRAHWEILLRARAIENLCYIAAANQGGHHENGRETYGHTLIVEPWGEVLTQQELGIGLSVAEIDLCRLRQLRQQFPCNEHHVLDYVR